MSDRDLVDDLFDNLDIVDDIELDIEDEVIYSQEMRSLILEELRKEISKLPIGRLVASIIEKESSKLKERMTVDKNGIESDISKSKEGLTKKIDAVKGDMEEEISKIKKKIDDMKTDILNIPNHVFGGFSPQSNDLNIGDPSAEGAWRIVKSGNDLSFQRYESGTWTEKGAFTP